MPDTRIVISGYYGYANPGDEAILSVLCSQLRQRLPNVHLTVLSGRPEETAATHNVDAVLWSDPAAIAAAVRAADLVITGGGGIFHDYGGVSTQGLFTEGNYGIAFHATAGLLAGFYEKPHAIYGVGIGPLFSKEARDLARAACESATTISVRDQASLSLLTELGIPNAELTACPGFLFEPGPIVSTPERVIVVVRQWSHGVDQTTWERELAAALDTYLQRHAGEVVFLPFQQFPGEAEDDVAASRRVLAHMRNTAHARIWEGTPPVREKAALIAGARLTVAMRLHAVIFALREHVPVVALTYDEKVRQVAQRAACPALDMPQLTAVALLDQMERALATTPATATPLIALAVRNTDLALEALRRGPAHPHLPMLRQGLESLLTEQKRLRHWLADQKTNYEYQVTVQQKDIAALTTHRDDLQQSLATEQQNHAATQQTLAETAAAKATLETNLASTTADRDTWRASSQQLDREKSTLLSEKSTLLAEKAALEGERASLQSDLTAWKKLHTDTVRDWDAYSSDLDRRLAEYRPQRAWRIMLAVRKAYVLATRQGLSGKLRLPLFLLSAAFGGGAVETEQLEFPQRPKTPQTLTNYNEGMTFRVVLEFDPETGSYSAVCPELPGCASAGATEDEARLNVQEAIKLYLAPAEIALASTAKLSEVTSGVNVARPGLTAVLPGYLAFLGSGADFACCNCPLLCLNHRSTLPRVVDSVTRSTSSTSVYAVFPSGSRIASKSSRTSKFQSRGGLRGNSNAFRTTGQPT